MMGHNAPVMLECSGCFRVLSILLLLSFAVFASNACDVATKLDFNSPDSPTDFGNNWKTLSVLGLLIASLMVSIMFMIGKTIDNPSLVNRAKTDINQIIVTAAILVAFSSFIGGICAIDGTQFGLAQSSLFDSARSYMEYSESVAFSAYISAQNSIMLLAGLSSLYSRSQTFPLGMYISVGIAVRPFSGFSVAIGALNFLSNLVMMSVAVTNGYMTILGAIENWFLNLLLPAGVVLRCFTPTRDFGGTLIALAIGLFVFYPLLFSFSYLLIGQPSPIGMPENGGWFSTIMGEFALFSVVGLIPFGLPFTVIGQLFVMGDVAGDSIMAALSDIGVSLLPVFILPAVNWIILVTIVRGLSKMMGEEIDISGLARLI